MRIADTPPAYCARCFRQDGERYVDFDAAYDGPVIPGSPNNVAIDDLVLCEACLTEAAALIGLEHPGVVAERADRAEQQLAAAEKSLLEQAQHIRNLEAAVASKPKTPQQRRREPVAA